MFTGIIDGIAKVILINRKDNFLSYTIQMPKHLLLNLKLGASVSNNGCCLSVVSIVNNHVSFDIISETLYRTSFNNLKIGDYINIERSKKFSDELGGHVVSGHISTIAICINVTVTNNNRIIYCKLRDKSFMKYIFYKGFISIDGISLTIGKIHKNEFCIHLIPDTLSKTTIKYKKKGNIFNIELDYFTQITVDTVERFMLRNKSD